MRIFAAELALLNLRGRLSEDEPDRLSAEESWQILRDEVLHGHAPEDFGEDLDRWEAWVDQTYTRLHRIARGNANYRLVGPATATGKHLDARTGAMVRVEMSAHPVAESSPIQIEDTSCRLVRHLLDANQRTTCFNAIHEGVRDCAARHRLVGATIAFLELDFHPVEVKPEFFSIAGARALSELIRIGGTLAL